MHRFIVNTVCAARKLNKFKAHIFLEKQVQRSHVKACAVAEVDNFERLEVSEDLCEDVVGDLGHSAQRKFLKLGRHAS